MERPRPLACLVHASVRSAALVGVEAIGVVVEASIAGGLPGVQVVGLPDAAVREAKERVRAALRAVGLTLPASRVVVNLAPADVRKEGPAFDLPIALALLAAQGRVPARPLATALVVGELGLDGTVRPVRGAVAIAVRAADEGHGPLLLPAAQARAAAAVPGLDVVPVGHLADAIAWARTGVSPRPQGTSSPTGPPRGAGPSYDGLDVSDVRGHAVAVRALEIAAAGGHHLLLVGPPGAGKSLLARRLPGLLPPLDAAAAIEVARIHSVAGLERAPDERRPPFREPHHASSAAGVLGSAAGPGELSLAHRGLLFLDELPEFDRRTLESLRQPLETGHVAIAAARARVRFPARFQLIAAMNACPCGFEGDPDRACRCHPSDRRRYRGRLSGPLLDRFDLRVAVTRAGAADANAPGGGSRRRADGSAAVAARAAAARALALARGDGPNAALDGRAVARLVFDDGASRLLEIARERGALSERGADQVRRVARTVADLAAAPRVGSDHVAEALAYRAAPWREDVDGA
jgi:magnesium chelatase family protein